MELGRFNLYAAVVDHITATPSPVAGIDPLDLEPAVTNTAAMLVFTHRPAPILIKVSTDHL